jgi:hypothetical protein
MGEVVAEILAILGETQEIEENHAQPNQCKTRHAFHDFYSNSKSSASIAGLMCDRVKKRGRHRSGSSVIGVY